MKFLYEAILTPWSGGWEAEFPDLGICTQGDTLFDAAFMAQDLLTLWISQALREGRPLPEPRMDHPTPANGKAIAVAVECDADTPSLTTMTVQEAADTLDVSTSRIHAMIRDGILRTEKVGSARLVSADDVIDYFNSPRTAGRPKKVATARFREMCLAGLHLVEEFLSVVDQGLLVDVAHVGLHGARGHEQLVGDVRKGATAHQQ